MNTTTNTNFKKKQIQVQKPAIKPVDPQILQQFREIIDLCSVSEWEKRLGGIDELNNWIEAYQHIIRNNQQSKFIQLVDTYCKLI